jgi:hypothetical protein
LLSIGPDSPDVLLELLIIERQRANERLVKIEDVKEAVMSDERFSAVPNFLK